MIPYRDVITPRKHWLPALLCTVLCLVLMALLDFFTGQELVFSGAYLLPVALTAWWAGFRWMIAMSVICGVTALIVDKLDGYAYRNPNIEYWNAGTCFLICFVTGWLLCRLRFILSEKQTANEKLRMALEKLEASTSEIRRLQGGLQIVCAWTNRIKVGEQWLSPEEFLRTQLHLELTHGISPEAFREQAAASGHA